LDDGREYGSQNLSGRSQKREDLHQVCSALFVTDVQKAQTANLSKEFIQSMNDDRSLLDSVVMGDET
jgi:hypothetical protein